MSSLDRILSNEVLRVGLTAELEEIQQNRKGSESRTARTLVKDGALRVTLITLAPGGVIATHRSSGPITIQTLAGAIDLESAGETHNVAVGEMVALQAGVDHSVSSAEGGTFLLTVVLSADAKTR